MITPRPRQQEVLNYRGGRMAVAAVPGSGKTTALSLLAVKLIAEGWVQQPAQVVAQPALRKVAEELAPGGYAPETSQVLVVTFSNAGVANFKSKIAGFLAERRLPRQVGYDVRTLHSLAHLIMQRQPTLAGLDVEFRILDETETSRIRSDAARIWIERNEERWLSFLEQRDAQTLRRWRNFTREIAGTVIRTAKTARLRPAELQERLSRLDDAVEVQLARMGAEIYAIYQDQLDTRAAVDFDDLVWMAYEQLRDHPPLLAEFRRRWPYILEDEAQDSSPLQEELLELLVGPDGNWVRVGDANQAINATFTSADPRFFRRFCRRVGVQLVPLDQSGRSALPIIHLANDLVRWVCEEYPEPDIRTRAFEWQMIYPVGSADPQPNPPAEESTIELWREYPDWRAELEDAARRAMSYARRHPEHTLAILVPTNALGHELVTILRAQGAEFDELLQAQSSSRAVMQVLSFVLDFVAEPARPAALARLFTGLSDANLVPLEITANPEHIARLLSSARVEGILFPEVGKRRRDYLPPRPETTLDDHVTIDRFAEQVARWVRASILPVDEFLLTVAVDLFHSPFDLAVAQQIATLVRRMADDNPSWGLEELAREVREIAFGVRGLPKVGRNELGFEPAPGRITVATMHGAKGMEWDSVYIVGADKNWFPELPADVYMGGLSLMEGDAEAEVAALIRSMAGDGPRYRPARSPTEEARLELIAERLRLLYVGITRAKRNLCISWSAQRLAGGGMYGRPYERPAEIAPVLEQLRRFQRRRQLHVEEE